jgi:hypothetical protein
MNIKEINKVDQVINLLQIIVNDSVSAEVAENIVKASVGLLKSSFDLGK